MAVVDNGRALRRVRAWELRLAETCQAIQFGQARSSCLVEWEERRRLLKVSGSRLALAEVVAEQIDQWFQHLASWEQTLEEMAAASTDQNFTEELGAIEQCKSNI